MEIGLAVLAGIVIDKILSSKYTISVKKKTKKGV